MWLTAIADEPVILVVGDSLSAAYGIDARRGWVALLQRRLQQQRHGYRVVNASISGDTTRGGLNRLPRALAQHRPRIVIIELGANDALRGLPLEEVSKNLAAMIETSQEHQVEVVLVGVRLPPNYGTTYTQRFQSIYRQLAQSHKVSFVPYLLQGIGEHDELMQADRLHPSDEAQRRMLDNVWPHLLPVLQGAGPRSKTRSRADPS